MPKELSSQLGLSSAPLSPPDDVPNETASDISVTRPFIKVEIFASVVPDSQLDDGRWYRYSSGFSSSLDDDNAALLNYIREDGQRVALAGKASLISCSSTDSLGGQSCALRFPIAGLMTILLPRLRPMDRVRVTVTVPGVQDWLVFDGLIRSIRSSRRAGAGWSAEVMLTCSGLEALLSGAIFNWQGFVHPASDILQGADGKTLVEALGTSAKAPHLIVQAFIESCLSSTMGLRVGDTAEDGLDILDYALFPQDDKGSWSSWPDVAYPLPHSLIASQKGNSFWGLAQDISESTLHEFFTGYREPDVKSETGVTPLRPALIHRPRPFPGTPKWDGYWNALKVTKIGGKAGFRPMGVDESLSMDRNANTFHWAGLGLGDHSKEAFNAKIFWGWASSFELVNRYGYSSRSVASKVAPIAPGAPINDYMAFSKEHLLHFAAQDSPLCLLKTRSIDAVFLPVRPGEVVEDHSQGSTDDRITTGYVVSTNFSLRVSGDSVALSMGATLERCLTGTDAANYPDRVRALLTDVELKAYAGQGVGSPGPHPAVSSTYVPPQPAIVPPPGLDEKIRQAIIKARNQFKIPGWLIAHVLLNETSMGRNMGGPTTAAAGIAQITSPAMDDLVNIGHTNPDGSLFTASDCRDVEKCIWACGRFLKRSQELIEANPGGFPANGSDYYSWVIRAYRNGAGDTRTLANEWGWKFPPVGEPSYPDYARYWSPDGVASGQKVWGWLG